MTLSLVDKCQKMITEEARQIFRKYAEVEHYLKQVIRSMHPDKVILFGSKATGEADKYSDTDLAVITHHVFDTSEIYGAVDIINFDVANEQLKERIQKQGIVLYKR